MSWPTTKRSYFFEQRELLKRDMNREWEEKKSSCFPINLMCVYCIYADEAITVCLSSALCFDLIHTIIFDERWRTFLDEQTIQWFINDEIFESDEIKHFTLISFVKEVTKKILEKKLTPFNTFNFFQIIRKVLSKNEIKILWRKTASCKRRDRQSKIYWHKIEIFHESRKYTKFNQGKILQSFTSQGIITLAMWAL